MRSLSRSEKGELVVKEQLQSEYWHIKYYALLISISCFLVLHEWNNRTSRLPVKAEVTVQLPDVPANTSTYTTGSNFALVTTAHDEEGEDLLYTVERKDGSRFQVQRKQLRHRVWHRLAFLGITNEKQTISITTQAFHERQLQFWRVWVESGREAALAYAANDKAGLPASYVGVNNLSG